MTNASVPLVGVTAAEVTLYTVVTCAAFLLENTDDRAPRITSAAAGCGLLATVVLAVVLVPGWGAVGAMAALALSASVQAGVMLVALRRQYGPPGRWVTSPAGGV